MYSTDTNSSCGHERMKKAFGSSNYKEDFKNVQKKCNRTPDNSDEKLEL